MYYGIYKNIRNSAWQCLLDFGITGLPVDLTRITEQAGIPLIRNSLVGEIRMGEAAKSFCDGNSWVIVFDDTLPVRAARFAVAHEIGHYLLGHDESFERYAAKNVGKAVSPAEKQADTFAARLLCPSCVLWGLDVQNEDEVAGFCLVEPDVARARYRRLQTLRRRNLFLSDPTEKLLYERFEDYIREHKHP